MSQALAANEGVALLGGTFDPIHFAHLRCALELKQALQLEQLRLVPCHIPSHRDTPVVSSEQRLQMLEQALLECPDLVLEACELKREKASYSIDTLRHIRAEIGPHKSLFLALGTDAFALLDTWHEWQQLLDYCHLVVMLRPGSELPQQGVVADLFQARQEVDLAKLKQRPQGGIYTLAVTALDISATQIRQQIAAGSSPQFLLPDSVWCYIQQQGLYQGCAAVAEE